MWLRVCLKVIFIVFCVLVRCVLIKVVLMWNIVWSLVIWFVFCYFGLFSRLKFCVWFWWLNLRFFMKIYICWWLISLLGWLFMVVLGWCLGWLSNCVNCGWRWSFWSWCIVLIVKCWGFCCLLKSVLCWWCCMSRFVKVNWINGILWLWKVFGFISVNILSCCCINILFWKVSVVCVCRLMGRCCIWFLIRLVCLVYIFCWRLNWRWGVCIRFVCILCMLVFWF